MADTINIYEAKAKFSQIIKKVETTGKMITICRNGKPVVDLIVHKEKGNPFVQDPDLKGAVYRADPCAPADEKDWPQESR